MITEREKREIIDKAVEETLLKIPEVVGALMMNHASKIRTNKKFYDKFPQFNENRDIVAAVIESIESSDVSLDFDQIIKKAIPEIKRQIVAVKDLDMIKVKKPDLDFTQGEL